MPDNKTATVLMLGQTVHKYNDNLYRLWPGMEVTVDQDTAERWDAIGLAEVASRGARDAVPLSRHQEFQAASDRAAQATPARQEVVRGDLRIASRHGDVTAARRLDELGPLESNDFRRSPDVQGTPPPLTLTNRGAGDEDEGTRTQASEPNPVRDGDTGATASAEGKPNQANRPKTTGESARGALSR